MMDLRTALIVFLLLVTEGDHQTFPENNNLTTTKTSTNQNSCICPTCPTTTRLLTSSTAQPSSLFHLSIIWTSACTGNVVVTILSSLSPTVSSPPSLVCSNSLPHVKSLLVSPCESRKGCKGKPKWPKSERQQKCYDITDLTEGTTCKTVTLECEAQTDSQLTAYKVVTALFCCVMLILLLIRFTKPTVRALQSRLSDRRQNRWIGPTQSHSVSYHRGKGVVQNTDREKRLSYPALERLTVSDSREPSSSRNSYNF